MTDALPCPECKSDNLAFTTGESSMYRRVVCNFCSYQGPQVRIDEGREPRDAAVEQWNERARK